MLVFVHGGAFVAGERRRPGTPFHDNVMLWAAEQGWVGVNLTYRLAPRHPWPAGGDDVLRAMRWLQNHLSRWNGDPNRTFLFGHSAGAAHAAEALVRSATDDAAAAWAGTLLLSGIYAPAAAESNPGREAYYGADRHLWHARGASDRLSRCDAPVAVMWSEFEAEEFAQQGKKMCERIREIGGTAHATLVAGHNHFSPVLSLGSGDRSFARLVRQFVAHPAERAR
ncbi:MAG: alpha/beta hydrolase [Gammaproteobacteria bacterium]|nr:alpha/beta hydrolase [Gammaproteobacteria bacterium]